MKKVFTPIIVLLFFSLFIGGCKKDNKDEASKSYFTFNNTEYNLAKGFLENYGKSGDEGYNLDLTLLSDAFVIHESSGEIDSITGTGSGINFEIFTSQSTKLDVKEYVYDATESGADGTFDFGMMVINYNAATEMGELLEITGGKVTVVSNGSDYEININCTTSNGKTITGHFKGPLKYYNYDKKNKSESGIFQKRTW